MVATDLHSRSFAVTEIAEELRLEEYNMESFIGLFWKYNPIIERFLSAVRREMININVVPFFLILEWKLTVFNFYWISGKED